MTSIRALVCVFALILPPGLGVAQPTAGSSLQKGLAAHRAGQPEEAIPALERALAADSSQARAYAVLASALLQTGQPDRAERIAEAGVSRFPDRLSLRLARAEALMKQERWSEALDAYQALEQKHDATTPLPPDVTIDRVRTRIGQLHRLVGQTHVEADRLDPALRHFKAARSLLPDSAATHADVAALHLKQEKWAAADSAAQRGLDRAPNHVRLLRIRSEALTRLHRAEALVPVLERLYRLQPNDVDVGLAYGRALMAVGQRMKGQKVFETLLDRHPTESKIYDALIALNERQLNYDAALKVLRRQRRQFPEDPELALREGRLLEKMEKYDAARSVYDSTRALTEPDDRTPALAIARTYVEQGRFEDATAAYRDVLDRDPSHAGALRALGRVYEKQERWTDALAVYHRLRDALDDPAEVYVKLGRVYEAMGEPTEAMRAYRTATKQDAEHPRAYVRYAVLRHEQRDGPVPFEVAEEALRKSLHALKRIQKKQLQQLQQTTREQTTQTGRPAAGTTLERERIKEYDAVAEEAFRFFADSFPPKRTEPVILDLLEEYEASAQLHYLTGVYYRRQEQVDNALKHLKRAVQESPDLRSAHLALGELYIEQDAIRKAIQSYERARALDEKAPDAYRALLDLYQQRDALDTLIRRWQARHRTHSDNEVLREHLIEALHKADRYEAARSLARTDSTAG